MAKKQTFEDKLKKGGKNLVKIKVVHSIDPEKKGNIKFKEDIQFLMVKLQINLPRIVFKIIIFYNFTLNNCLCFFITSLI